MSNVVSITSLLKTNLDNRHILSKFEHPKTEEKYSPMPMSYMEDYTEEVETVTGKPKILPMFFDILLVILLPKFLGNFVARPQSTSKV